MKNKLLLSVVAMFVCIFANSFIYAYANSYNNLTFEASDGEVTITGCDSSIIKAVIPSKIYGLPVTTIGESAFSGCTELVAVNISEGITTIEYCAFYGCSSLSAITIPESVTTIGDSVFGACSILKDVKIGSGVTAIGANTFEECSMLNSITIPDNIMTLGDFAFYNCSALADVTFGSGITTIGKNAFENCTSLVNVTVPDSVTSIGDYAFSGCSSLEEITLGGGVTEIGGCAFWGCDALDSVHITSLEAWCNINFADRISTPLYEDAVLYVNNEQLESLVIPDGIAEINGYAFLNCEGIVCVVIPDSVISVGYCAFDGCTDIKTVFYTGSEEDWNVIEKQDGNERITEADIVFNAIERTYSFNTGCDTELPDITAYCISSSPAIVNGDKTMLGWYDNISCSGDAVTFPYYGEATTLYAKWSDRTGADFASALIAEADKTYSVTTTEENPVIYYEFTPSYTGRYRFYTADIIDTCGYLYDSSQNLIVSNDNTYFGEGFYISEVLTAGEKYYIAAELNNSTGMFELMTESVSEGAEKSVYITSPTSDGWGVVIPGTVSDDCQIVFACYSADMLVGIQIVQNNKDRYFFEAADTADCFKIMLWESMSSMLPEELMIRIDI